MKYTLLILTTAASLALAGCTSTQAPRAPTQKLAPQSFSVPAEVLTQVLPPPLKQTGFGFTSRQEDLRPFVCAIHQPSMDG